VENSTRSPVPIDSQAQLIELLETLYNSHNPTRRWLHRTRRDWLIARIAECARERPGRALEVGFGAGVYLNALAANYREVVATDMAQDHLDHAAPLTVEHPNLTLFIDDITCSRLPAQHFDLVLCSEVIEHLRDGPSAIAGIRRLLAPEGFLLLSTPQRYSLMELSCKLAFLPGIINAVRWIYGEAVFETGHINLMTEREMTRLLESAGFRIRRRFRSGLYLPLVAEFASSAGLRIERWLEERLRERGFSWLLWTQYYLAQI
jgi:2-polyprenyl-3-methyl-5-hydroxy-6-metoxy-1,4-benzoquinol methylase